MNKRNIVSILVLLLIAGVATANGGTYDSSVTLENKDPSTWQIIDDEFSVVVEYNMNGPKFDWYIHGKAMANGCYDLIYYADDQFDKNGGWGGNHPGAWIGTVVQSRGVIDTTGSTELNMNLPALPDGNIAAYSYGGSPDYYRHAHGAKLWLVPHNDYKKWKKQVVNWAPTTFMFETDLIHYYDTDVVVCDGTVCYEGDLYDMTRVNGTCVRNNMIEADCDDCYEPHDPCGGKLCDGLVCVGYDLYTMYCDNGECKPYQWWKKNATECGYVPPETPDDEVPPDDPNRLHGDVTGDGTITIEDALLLFNYVTHPDEQGTTYILK